MNKEEADLPQRMKDMAKHEGWQIMKEDMVKRMSLLSDPVWGRKGIFPINITWWDRRDTFTVMFLLHLAQSNIMYFYIMSQYWRAQSR